MKNYIYAILGAGFWVNANEFVRNDLVLRQTWIDGFKRIGLVFPNLPLNGLVWILWGFVFVTVLTILISRFPVFKSTIIAWLLSYVLLWIAMFNLGVLPKGILYWAIPWSFIEIYFAALIATKFIKVDGASGSGWLDLICQISDK